MTFRKFTLFTGKTRSEYRPEKEVTCTAEGGLKGGCLQPKVIDARPSRPRVGSSSARLCMAAHCSVLPAPPSVKNLPDPYVPPGRCNSVCVQCGVSSTPRPPPRSYSSLLVPVLCRNCGAMVPGGWGRIIPMFPGFYRVPRVRV